MMSRESEWRGWKPHIHAPGTVVNNQVNGPTAWEDYLSALENAAPAIEAIAVSDNYVTDTYEAVCRLKVAGRLQGVKLVFPNVELRLDVATAKGGFVNIHLFVSPEDQKHLEEFQRLLSRLQFNVMQDRFDCTRSDLIRLGKMADPDITDDRAALAYGANQFKLNFQQLREVFSKSGWAKKNTRGIVLLLLYLAPDDSDSRPLVIDQPEENLDPKSVFDELVHLFVEARAYRQVIMVTHNANLVINMDADQIIIAESGPHPPGALPPITYQSGGLENAQIRKLVCDILEGGEGAFQERARRLRVHLER